MSWDFETDPEWQEQLDWVAEFLAKEVEPLEYIIVSSINFNDPLFRELIPPLQEQVKARGLWACHLGPELGGRGFGQLKLALLNEVLGTCRFGPAVFGCSAPDTGNGEILAHYGTDAQKEQWLEPLLDGRITSAFSMTEPHGGADPTLLKTTAELDGAEWVLNGEKWFTSNAKDADFLLMFVVTEPDGPPHQRASMMIVPKGTPGLEIVRNVGWATQTDDEANEGYLRMTDARIPADCLLGGRGQAFAIAQTRLGGGRIHHAMRTIGAARKAFEMMLERSVSRRTKGELLAKKQMVQVMIADSYVQLEQFRLFVLQTAWKIDKYQDYKRVRMDISAVKAVMPKVLHDIASAALQVHGSLGLTNEMPFVDMIVQSYILGLGDGPTEVHKVTVARELTSRTTPTGDLFPTTHIPKLREAAVTQYADALARHGRSGAVR